MKTKAVLYYHACIGIVLFLLIPFALQSQIGMQGLISENEGSAAWDADGSGPEPYGNGHGTYYYYASSRDYVDLNSSYGAHITTIAADFPAFTQALTDNGFTPGQVKLRVGLGSQGEDIPGSDWFVFGDENYMNFYPVNMMLFLADEMMVSGMTNYIVFHQGPSTGYLFECESNYFVPVNASGNSSQAVKNVASAFLQDVGTYELKMVMNTFGSTQTFSNNGRSGSYFNFNSTLVKGQPELPFRGLAADNEGFAGWDADGTGPEPKGDGHDSQKYYIASRDYDGIDPDPDACFAHLLTDGIEGFQNLALQLAYQGFTFEQIKIKMGLRDLGEDVEGEDWSYISPIHAVNFYHCDITAELSGEPLFGFVCDTAQTFQNTNNPALGWWGTSAQTVIYNASANSSGVVQAIAEALFKDLDQRGIRTITEYATTASGAINSNGRTGGFWQVNEAKIVAVPFKGTMVQPGNVSGHWTMDGHPYLVTGDITLPDGQELVIDPGVWVKFADRVHFRVLGSLQAVGTSSNNGSIFFTAANPGLGWGHIEFDNVLPGNAASEFGYCVFEYGYAPEAMPYTSPYNCGGALAVRDFDNFTVYNCVFQHNRALNDAYYPASGGAIALWNCSPEIRNCIFKNNTASCAGGILAAYGSSPVVSNCLFVNNMSQRIYSFGGGAFNAFDGCNPVLLNNTFVNNHSNFNGGAMEIYEGSNPVLIGNILRNNTSPEYNQIYISTNNCNVDITYNNIQGGQAGIGPNGIGSGVYENNMDTDPLFEDVLALNFMLGAGSPCIDAGIPDITGLNLPPDDLMGNCRIWDGGVNGYRIDMGPYEYGAPPYITGLDNQHARMAGMGLSAYPNPFTDRVTLEIEVTESIEVEIAIFNQMGQQVKTLVSKELNAGIHQVEWQADNLPEGVYLCRMQIGNKLLAGRIVKVK